MKSFGNVVVKCRHLIMALALVLMVPAVWGYLHTRVNYDILTYLPDSIETIQGQNILMDDFGTGAITMLIVEDKEDKDIVALKHEIEKVEHVKRVLWYDSFADITVPKEMLPQKVRDAFINGNATMLAVIYDSSTSSDETMDAVTEIRKVLDSGCYLHHRYKGSRGGRGTHLRGSCCPAGFDRTGAEHGYIPCAGILPPFYRNCDYI